VSHAALYIADHDTSLIVVTALECAGFTCDTHGDLDALMRTLRQGRHDLVVLTCDASARAVEAVIGWRERWLEGSVALVAIGEAHSPASIRALQLGADDVVLRPVRGPELLARVGAAMRRLRKSAPPEGLGRCACRVDDVASALVSLRGRVELTPRELGLARLLFDNIGQTVSRERISQEVLGQPDDPARRSIEQHVYQLRKKLRRAVGEDIALRGVYGGGYRLDVTLSLSDQPVRDADPRRLLQTADLA
jgi:DNA-binding response OmpR family regulator